MQSGPWPLPCMAKIFHASRPISGTRSCLMEHVHKNPMNSRGCGLLAMDKNPAYVSECLCSGRKASISSARMHGSTGRRIGSVASRGNTVHVALSSGMCQQRSSSIHGENEEHVEWDAQFGADVARRYVHRCHVHNEGGDDTGTWPATGRCFRCSGCWKILRDLVIFISLLHIINLITRDRIN